MSNQSSSLATGSQQNSQYLRDSKLFQPVRDIDDTEEVELQDMHNQSPNRRSKIVKNKKDFNGRDEKKEYDEIQQMSTVFNSFRSPLGKEDDFNNDGPSTNSIVDSSQNNDMNDTRDEEDDEINSASRASSGNMKNNYYTKGNNSGQSPLNPCLSLERREQDPNYKQRQAEFLASQPYQSNGSGDFVDECIDNFQANPQPRRLGNLICYWYNSQNSPRIVIGPDWVFSVIELIIMNGLAGYFVFTTDSVKHSHLFGIGFMTLLLQDISFIWLVLQNPGLPSRDIKIHTDSYINKVRILKPHLFCSLCKVVYRQDTETEHCMSCGYCIEELDHHCPWSSKCIGRGNMLMFKAFLFMTVALMVYLFSGGMFSIFRIETTIVLCKSYVFISIYS
eukprot:403360859